MYTGLSFENFEPKRILGYKSFGQHQQMYLEESFRAIHLSIYDTDIIIGNGYDLTADGVNKFKIELVSGASPGFDGGDGYILQPLNSEVYEGVEFENEAEDYYVACYHVEVPQDVLVNPVTGLPQWTHIKHEMGWQVGPDPSSVVDNGNGTITFSVDSTTESNVNNSGRMIKIWKKVPVKDANTYEIALETCTVFYDGGVNKITTTGSFGQSTISTNHQDYECALIGPRVMRYLDLRNQHGHVFLGIITGGGRGGSLASVDTSDQRIMPYTWVSALMDGLPQDLYPATDNIYNLGKPTHRWANIYTTNFDMSGDFLPATDDAQDIGSNLKQWKDIYIDGIARIDSLSLSTVNGEGSATIVPIGDSGYDLGSPSYEWRNLYVDLTAYIDTLDLSNAAGEGVLGDFVPVTNGDLNLGNTSYRWDKIWSDKAEFDWLTVGSPIGGGVLSNLVPSLDDSFDLGNASYRWQNLFLSGTATMHDVFPETDGDYDLGSSGAEWKDIYIDGIAYVDELNVSDTAGEGVASDLVPNATTGINLGNGSYKWDDANIIDTTTMTLTVSALTNKGCAYHFMPTVDGAWDLGWADYRWGKIVLNKIDLNSAPGEGVYAGLVPAGGGIMLGNTNYKYSQLWLNKLYLTTTAGEGCSNDLVPADTSRWLGNNTYYWQRAYIDDIRFNSSATFDNYDDLALIEAYKPIDKFVESEKGGEKRIIQQGDMNTVPWPMLGDSSSMQGNHHLKLGDSTMFLLGAIKQLYSKHKKALERIDVLEKEIIQA